MQPKLRRCIVATAALLLSGICFAAIGYDRAVHQAESSINQALHAGDSDAKIEAFLRRRGWPFDFDPFNWRYQSRVPGSERPSIIGDSEVILYIYVAQDRSFQKAEVRRVYTSL